MINTILAYYFRLKKNKRTVKMLEIRKKIHYFVV